MKRNFFRRALAAVLCLTLLDVSNLTALATNENPTETVATVSGADAGSTAAGEDNTAASGTDAGNAAATVSDGNAAAGNSLLTISEIPVPLTAAVPVVGNQKVQLTIRHYLAGEQDGAMLFAPSDMTAENGQTISVARTTEYYSVSSVAVDGETVESQDGSFELKLDGATTEATVDVYYQETSGTYQNDTGMIDYDNGWSWKGDTSSINYEGNYAEGSSENNRIGTRGLSGAYEALVEVQGEDGTTYHFNINDYYRYDYKQNAGGVWVKDTSKDYRTQFPILQGLLKGLSKSEGSAVYDIVEFNYDDPGFFTSDAKAGKTILDGYSLEFDRSGMTYELTKVRKDDEVVCSDMGSFFPLNQGGKNEFFGMRYDFSFTVGDYVGDMTYSFTGDDDLWVCLDGEVILDLGGVHDPYPVGNAVAYAPGSVDVWTVLLGEADYTLQDKIDYVSDAANASRTHAVTVLFMERGGNASNCNMRFVMPNVVADEAVVSTVTKAALTLNKVDAADGSVMEGVSFTLTDGGDYVQTLSTDEQGAVSFSGLTAGTYTLTETTPAGYQAAGPWTVTVTASESTSGRQTVTTHSVTGVKNSSTGAALTEQGGVYTIENRKTEIVETDIELDIDKSVSLIDWEERTYKITLEASSLVESVQQTSGSVDIVFALDVSQSMTKTKMTQLKNAVNSFINSVAAAAPNSRVAIVSFGGGMGSGQQGGHGHGKKDNKGNTEELAVTVAGLTVLDAAGVKSLTGAVNGITNSNPGTPYYAGLNLADELLKQSTNPNKYVIFVSDGEPTVQSSTASDKEKEILSCADSVKEQATLMTLGIELGNANSSTRKLMKKIATSESYFYEASNSENMTEILNGLSGTIVSELPVEASVVDYIDSRFEATDAEGNPLEEGAVLPDANGKEGVLRKDANGSWYVAWQEVSIAHATEGTDGTTAGWSADIYVRAREEFIGGNMIPTNGPDSGVIVEEELYPFEKPTANVKLLDLVVEDAEETLFLGEEITPGEYAAELNETIQVISLEDEKVALAGAPVLSEEQAAELVTQGTLEVPYGYTSDVTGCFTYTLAEDVSWQNHTADRVGEAVEKYTLTVTYTAYTVEKREELLGEGYKEPAMTQKAESVQDEGVYTVNVVAGTLVIKKKLDTADIDFTQGDPVFTFKVMKDGKFYSCHTVRFTKAMADAGKTEVTVAVLEELAKGTYTVEEAETLRYELKDVTVSGTVSAETKDGKAVFRMEKVTGSDGTIKAAEAQAAFTNERVNDRNFSDTDVAVNCFVIGEDGTISWTADTLMNQ